MTPKNNKLSRHNKLPLKALLSLATSALLGTTVSSKTVAKDASDWQFQSAFLLYSEADRVTAGEVVLAAKQTSVNEEVLSVKLTIDALTGASANGAIAQPSAQTYTRPSGYGQYVTPPGETPLDDTFHDTRVQLNGQWTQPLTGDITGSIGGHLSKEYDYLSLGLNGNLAYDFNNNNSTVSMGLSYFKDILTPEGGIPKPFASMYIHDSLDTDSSEDNNGYDDDKNTAAEFLNTRIRESDNKSTADIMFGVTQVINRRMITAFNYSYSQIQGYLADPFKIVSVLNNEGLTQDNIYERRPNSRTKQSTYLQAKYHFDEALFNTVADISYRYMWDDWGIKSHTLDSRFTVPLGQGRYVEPHIRFYQQSAADFYKPYVFNAQIPTTFVSADYRIGEMTALTVGAKYGFILNNGNELSFRLEYYCQIPTNSRFVKPTALSTIDLYPKIEALIAQVSYAF